MRSKYYLDRDFGRPYATHVYNCPDYGNDQFSAGVSPIISIRKQVPISWPGEWSTCVVRWSFEFEIHSKLRSGETMLFPSIYSYDPFIAPKWFPRIGKDHFFRNTNQTPLILHATIDIIWASIVLSWRGKTGENSISLFNVIPNRSPP